MITFCRQCFLIVRVIDDSERQIETLVGQRSDFYTIPGLGYRCIECPDAKADFYLWDDYLAEDVLRKAHFRELSAEEYFRALMGVGTPDELRCDAATVCELFASKRVKSVSVHDLRGSTRCELRRIEFEDGTVLHLGSSVTNGAIAFRITRPISYTRKVLDGIG